ncbi:primase-helicase family protein [Limnobacter sp.]|uniref:primase-helicase family protein n=1 Tax=Limnobacter sp. TaxID=2003368 RepID=UPI0025B8AC5A|nr:primase-helicase family protein [Limnobacter sp.]
MNVPGFTNKKELTADDVQRAADTVIAQLPAEFQDVTYIAQASSSLGMKGDRVSMHIYIALTVALPVKAVKLWLRHLNYTVDMFSSQLELSVNGQALKYPLDPSVADNSKLIFIAPPDYDDDKLDPFQTVDDRLVLVERSNPTVDLAPLLGEVSPEATHQAGLKFKDDLRKRNGLKPKKARLQTTTIQGEVHDVLMNPDQMSVQIVDTTNLPFVRCNINGGDSGAYWFNIDDPTYMYNFKDEPVFEIEKADREFYASIFDTYEQELANRGRVSRPVALRDFYTDTYYNGLFDPNINQFDDDFPLTPTQKTSIQSFMRSHGRQEPDFIPDARVVFDPCTDAPAVQMEETPYYVNMYRKTDYMLNSNEAPELTYGTAAQLAEVVPLTYKLIHHMLGSGTAETEHFINWLAYIYQTRRKSMTAWIFTGVPGTGKGLFANKILKPLFGHAHVPMKSLENIEEQFNLYMRSALFLVVDEFRMTDAHGGSLRMADKLKNQITEPTMTIRAMRANQIELPSYTNFIFLTNRPDAVKIEPGDRRYNVSPRQETKLEIALPEVIEGIDDLENELHTFAGALQAFNVDKRMARTCMNNAAKDEMRTVTMSVFEEFCEALQRGNLQYFLDVLDISLDDTFNSSRIVSAQRFVKAWIADADKHGMSVIPVEHLRTVYHTQTEQHPAIANREFHKRLDRFGLRTQQKRQPGADRGAAPIRGIIVEWTTDNEQLTDVIEQHFDDQDKRLILNK